jgi:universal stress protein E
MSHFQNILVGIDLSHCSRLSFDALPRVALALFRRSVWLAQRFSAKITFFSALNLTEELLLMLEEKHRFVVIRKIEDEASAVVGELVRKARESGVAARGVFVRGIGWFEIVHQVLREKHDLVMVATRESSGMGHRLFGNTAKKLLRRCPCPVWVCKPDEHDGPLNILVASDLRPASGAALRLAVGLARAADANIHLLHAIDYPVYHLWLTALPDEVGRDYHLRVLGQAEKALRDQLEQTDHRTLVEPVRIHITDKVGQPDRVILQCIRERKIDLLVIGTVGRSGAAGAMIGNTAERLLPELTCSVLAVKPPDYRCRMGVS